jgi:hypothetical protein
MLTKKIKQKNKNKKLPFLPHHKTRKLTMCDNFKQRYIELSGISPVSCSRVFIYIFFGYNPFESFPLVISPFPSIV